MLTTAGGCEEEFQKGGSFEQNSESCVHSSDPHGTQENLGKENSVGKGGV